MAKPLSQADEGLRRVVARVALLNLAYFGVEFSVALAIGSVSLFADSIDFLEDTSVNFLILIALGWSARTLAFGHGARWHPAHSGTGHALDGLGQIPASVPPAPLPLSLTGAGAMAVNLTVLLAIRPMAAA